MAGTAADLLTMMTVFNNELRVGAGQADEARALQALIIAQHHFETLCAMRPRILETTINVATVTNTEASTWASSLMRLDAIWFLGVDGRPIYKLKRIEEVGGHVPSLPWPMTLVTLGSPSGPTAAYYGNMANFYWMPLPDGAHSMRIYGFIEQAEPTTRAIAFGYPNRCKSAIAAFAAQMLRVGLDDDGDATASLAATLYAPLLKSLQKFDRSEPHAREYTDVHTT